MKAIHITKSGGPEVLQLQDTPIPLPKSHQVVIKVKAAGLNRSDISTRENLGAYGNVATGTMIPGLEVSGEIVEMGSTVTNHQIGDKVCALIPSGGYAEYVAVESSHCLPIPEGISLIDAAALPETVFTVWFNVFHLGQLKPGEKLLIHGGTSGIGSIGLQMAKALGSTIYSTVGSDEKMAFLNARQLGTVINYKKQAFETLLKDENIDVILDMVGGDYTQKNLDLLNHKGRLVNINGMKSMDAQIDLLTVMRKNLTLTGSLLKPQSDAVKTMIAEAVEQTIWPLFRSKQIEPIVYKTFPLKAASEAQQLMESSTHIGKILLTMD
ncbi:NAD(P)H-quinone oxidoreductase [Gelidibacter gilvus]|uniref:NAD(P)H-quinone oxidoreductase n=1 Tax=Gelidibacter gilvus TaxID=59602 RepID=A0A4Q0XG30_9FLAO|nr:NAD(P)H-quinone oxidoreductase [Gelidibacter gilvus]RXJ50026.1 NAD(P)H-quinone oxidoreductase [Gelidibacter gilvus]